MNNELVDGVTRVSTAGVFYRIHCYTRAERTTPNVSLDGRSQSTVVDARFEIGVAKIHRRRDGHSVQNQWIGLMGHEPHDDGPVVIDFGALAHARHRTS